MDIKSAKTNIRKQVGGSLLTSILSIGRTLAPTLGKTLGLSALAGLASEGASQLVKKISGGNLMSDIVGAERTLATAFKKISGGQVGGFLIPQSKINQLIAYKHLLSAKQKQNIFNALQTGSGVYIRPTKTQQGNGFGTILASLGIPLAIELVKEITGKGAPRLGRSTGSLSRGTIQQASQGGTGAPPIGMYEPPPPFIGTWEQMSGSGKKKTTRASKKGQGLLLGANSPFKNVPLLNLIL